MSIDLGHANLPQEVIRMNQVIASSQIYRGEIEIEERDVENQDENRQRMLSIGTELWVEIKQRIVEYNMDHSKDCRVCSICLSDFQTRQKDENVAGDSVIQLSCNK